MKRALVLGLAGFCLASFSPDASAAPMAGYHWATRHITIIDGIAAAALPKPNWEVARNTVLMRYMAADFSFTVVETDPIYCPVVPQQGTIVLCYGNGVARMEPYQESGDPDHIVAATLVIQQDRGLFCHELGHALGLAHYNRKPKQRSCIWGIETSHPSSHDVAALLATHQD